jgi:hypothetical protein
MVTFKALLAAHLPEIETLGLITIIDVPGQK